jgi:hypothetical protein
MRRIIYTWEIECYDCHTTVRRESTSHSNVTLPVGWGQTTPYQMEYGYSNPYDLCPVCFKKYREAQE